MRRTSLAALLGTASLAVTFVAQAAGAPNQAAFGAPYGGFAAYHGVLLKTEPKAPAANKALAYRGPKLELAQAYVGRKAAEPTLGVGGSPSAIIQSKARTHMRSSCRAALLIERAAAPHDFACLG